MFAKLAGEMLKLGRVLALEGEAGVDELLNVRVEAKKVADVSEDGLSLIG